MSLNATTNPLLGFSKTGVPAVPTEPDRAIKRGAKFQVTHDSVDIFNTAALDGVATNDSVPILVGEADWGMGSRVGWG